MFVQKGLQKGNRPVCDTEAIFDVDPSQRFQDEQSSRCFGKKVCEISTSARTKKVLIQLFSFFEEGNQLGVIDIWSVFRMRE